MENYAKNVVVVFCYLVRDKKVMLIRRNFPPLKNQYTIVGGKKEPGEDLLTACKREVFEETNLVLEQAELKGIINNSTQGRDYDVLTCYFLSDSFSGNIKSSHEGNVEWCNIEESYEKEGISEFYQKISPHVFGNNFFHGTIHINEEGRIENFAIEA
ncbi:NUDIX domain-containing protein [Acetobacterium bakii]|uniref:NUDIX domain-containing protein n=1 Tax=Acetobacterium bakii TaxID=52689 RepID=UPI0006802F63|nr:NUDIX domain-containing protein [Acetobacterium bakii]